MSAVKHITGVLLATVGVLFALGSLGYLFAPDPEMPMWFVAILFILLGVLPLAGAFKLLRTTLTAPGKSCPQCGGTERQPAGVLRRSHHVWLWPFGGWLFASLWGASREQQVRCGQCDTLYLTDTRATRIAGVLLWVFLLLVAFVMIAGQFENP